LIEREVLLRAAPHIVWPMRFVLPHSPEQRPAWMVRLGLFLYDHLGGRNLLPASRSLDLRRAPEGAPIRPTFPSGFEYSDCWVDDARLVILNVCDAADRGATIRVRTAATSARRADGLWSVTLRHDDGPVETVTARILVNAAGPWVADVMQGVVGLNTPAKVRLVKGSHIIVRKFWDGPQAYLLQNDDKRVIFVNPYEDGSYETGLCLIGTTDIPYEGDADAVSVDASERHYLLRVVNRYMNTQLTVDDIVSEFAGIRPLYDDQAANPSAVTRDYVFDIDHRPGDAPLLSVFGGKITTYRKLAEHALDKLTPFIAAAGPVWTDRAPLPGGDMPDADFDRFLRELSRDYQFLPASLARHYARLYGTRARTLLGTADAMASLGRHFGGLLYEIEARYLRHTEWARRADDILSRRTKHGLHLTQAEQADFSVWMGQQS
jgi:glycerol-3-phosphate dehydrogenase